MDFFDLFKIARQQNLKKRAGKTPKMTENKPVLERCEKLHEFFTDYANRHGGELSFAMRESAITNDIQFCVKYAQESKMSFNREEMRLLSSLLDDDCRTGLGATTSGKIRFSMSIDSPLLVTYQ